MMKNNKTANMALVFMAAIAMAAVLALFTGCRRQDSSTITLNLWHIYSDETRRGGIEQAARQFEAENPGTRVVISIFPNDPYKIRLRVASPNDFPDVFHSWGGGWLQSFVDEGFVADITAEANAVMHELNPSLVALNTFNGHIYGVPYFAGVTVLYYNREIFERFNLTPPATFAELERLAATLIANGITPFAEANRSRWPGAQHFVLLAMRLGGGDIFTRAHNGEVPFTDPAFIRAGEMLTDMVNRGWFPTGVNGLDWDTGQSRIMFYTGQGAMILQTGAFINTARTENIDFHQNRLAIARYPAIDGELGRSTDILGGNNVLSASAHSRYPELAKKLALFIAADRQVQQNFLDNGAIAALPNLNPPDGLVRTLLEHLTKATYLQNFIDQTLSPELAERHLDTVQGLFGLTMTPQQAAATMQRAFDDN